MSSDGLMEIRGVVGMNGRGELCFFAHSRAEGLPILGDDGRAMTSSLAHLPREVREAPPRRVSHADIARLDPGTAGIIEDVADGC